MAQFFYKPKGAWAADFIPLYDKGVFWLFYLNDWRNKEDDGEGTPWYLIRTRDFVHYEEMGEAVPRGSADSQDLYVFTGSALAAENAYHIFYTGHNPHLREQGAPCQAVLHCVSDDLLHWHKLPDEVFYPGEDYETHDWRDPFVYRDEAAGCYRMLLAARWKDGNVRRRGVTAMATSVDLTHWSIDSPLWAPGLYFTHECPDYFVMGEFEYLIYSEFSSGHVTRYVMRRQGESEWQIPKDDRLDGRAWYAAKTAYNGVKRYAFGWIATRENEHDDGAWQWGGCLNVHEVYAAEDGTLRVKEPASVASAFADTVSRYDDVTLNALGGRAERRLGTMPDVCRIEMTFEYTQSVRAISLLLHGDASMEAYVEVRIEPADHRMVIDRWPRPGDQPYMTALERPLSPQEGRKHTLSVIVDGTAACAYYDDETALSFRLYTSAGSHFGVAVVNGRLDLSSTRIQTLAAEPATHCSADGGENENTQTGR